MPIASHSAETGGGFETPFSQAGKMQIVFPDYPVPPPGTIVGSATWDSGLMYSNGYQNMSVGVNMSNAGTLNIIRYIDTAGVFARTTTTVPIVAATSVILDTPIDYFPWVTFRIQVVNGAGTTSTINSFSVLMSSY